MMDDLAAFERRLASELDRMAGPGRRIDAMAVARAAATQSHKWRFRAMFSATRFVAAAAIVALFGGFAIVGVVSLRQADQLAPGAASPSPTTTESLLQGLVTEEVEPGVERIVRDDAGHDLDETHPTYRLDMDGIAVTRDGTVWVTSTYHDTDNDAKGDPFGRHPLVWALGRPGALGSAEGVPTSPTFLVATADGSLLIVGDTAVRLDGAAFVADDGPAQRLVRGGTLWLIGPDVLVGINEGAAARPSRLLAAIWTDYGEWLSLAESGRSAETSGRYCSTSSGDGVLCEGPGDTETRYLGGTPIVAIAVAPDGSIWAVGDWDGGGGGLYHITFP